ncbi:MAG: hypothetical protein GAK30_01767 [Paracidovorax wautersii]|uniref:YfhG lipoprotein n=1 Tax=Paracidovorax wautersii TaxID=1177982 RepID=A0A7V8FPC2_9BURK|nr:MAG: hypothetical protein GAK30_01767 [Paracidovorax wautersii]
MGLAAVLATAAAGCAVMPAPQNVVVEDAKPTSIVVPTPAAPPAASPAAPAQDAPAPAGAPLPDPAYIARRELITQPLKAVLNYADRIRVMGANDLNREITRLTPLADQPDPEVQPQRQLQLALALAQRNPPDLARAMNLAQRVQDVRTPLTLELQPLARLLLQRLGEQRRVEDMNDRQGQLLRDTQKRLDAAHERLEALKAIERSLSNTNRGNGAGVPAARTPAP